METKQNECPNCNVELEWTNVSDIYSGDVTMDVSCYYCPKCLYVEQEQITLSHI